MNGLTPKPNYGLIGHRGAASVRPENTLCGFHYAAELGLNWIEFDVQLTKDKQWVVFHDDTLERTTNGKGKLTDHTLAQLRKLDAGSWFAPEYGNEQIPTLEEVIKLAIEYNISCNIELKSPHSNSAAEFTKFIQQQRFLPNILLSSFNSNCVKQLQHLLPQIPRAYVVEEFIGITVEHAKDLGAVSIHACVKDMRMSDLIKARQNDLLVLLYTVNEPQIARDWLQAGVTAVFTDCPDLFEHTS